VLQELLTRLSLQVPDDKGVRLDVGDELLLLLEDVLEVVKVALRILLVHELLDKLLLAQLCQPLQVLP